MSGSTRAKRVLIVSHYYPPHIGGIEYVAYNQATRLAERGTQVTVVTSKTPGDPPSGIAQGVRVVRVPAYNGLELKAIPFPIFAPSLLVSLWREVRQADIVHIHDVFYISSFCTALMARVLKKPTVITQHVALVSHSSKLAGTVQRLVYKTTGKWVLNKSSRVITMNSRVKQFLVTLGVAPSKIVEMSNGVDMTLFHPQTQKDKIVARKAFKLPERAFIVLFIGRFVPKKGFELMREAGSNDYLTVFAGGETDLRPAENQRFLGRLDQAQLAALYQAADLFVLPSDSEGFPLTAQEAMASGVPVILKYDPGYERYNLTPEEVVFMEGGGATKLKALITGLQQDPDRLRAMTKQALRYVETHFTWEHHMSALQALYGDVLGERKHPKVLIVAPYFYPHPGGVESYTRNIAKELIASGWEVVVVTSAIPGSPLEETFEGIKVYRLKKAFSVSNTPIGWRWRSQLKRIYRVEKPDVINGHVPVPYLADIAERVRGRIPFVLTYHNDLSKTQPLQKIIAGVLNHTIIARTLRRADHIITTSEYYAETSPLLRPFVDKVSVVSPGINTNYLNPRVKPTAIAAKYRGKRVILFVGSIGKSQQHKGLDTLIAAFALLRKRKEFDDTQLVVVGAGDGASMYKDVARELGVGESVELTGYVSDELLPQYFKRAAVFAMPSKDRSEGFGMVFMEAAATGTPVIGTNVGGIPYAIKDGETGLIIKPDDPKALTHALAAVLSNPELARRLGDSGAKRAATEFGWPGLSERTADLLIKATRPTVVQIAGYYPPSLGGMERVAQSLSERLAEREYDVRVLTSNVNQPKYPPAPLPHLHIERFKAFEFAHTTFAPGFIPALFRVPKRSVLHLHLSQAFYPEWTLLVSKLRHIPYIVHFHLDLQPSGPLGLLFVPYKSVVIRAVIARADAVIVFSNEQRDFIHATYHADKKKIFVIPNGVGDEYFMTRSRFSKRGSHALLYVGRINSQKRVNLLTEALGLMHESAKLTIVGDGEDRRKIEAALPVGVASRVTFTGRVSPDEVLPYFKKAEVFVLASKVEGMPLAILEAMASGLPIVGADVSGIKELVNGVGVLVQNPSAAAFARKLDELLVQPARLEELSRKSSDRAKQYSWSALVDRLEHLYKDVGQ